jgi:hypothetical protein
MVSNLVQVIPFYILISYSLGFILISYFHLRLRVQSGLFPSDFSTKMWYTFLNSSMCTKYHIHIILLHLITLIIHWNADDWLFHYAVTNCRGKGKVVPVFQLTTTPWRLYEEVEVYLHTFLISALDGCEWSVSRPGRFAPRERAPSTRCIGGSLKNSKFIYFSFIIMRQILKERYISWNNYIISFQSLWHTRTNFLYLWKNAQFREMLTCKD